MKRDNLSGREIKKIVEYNIEVDDYLFCMMICVLLSIGLTFQYYEPTLYGGIGVGIFAIIVVILNLLLCRDVRYELE